MVQRLHLILGEKLTGPFSALHKIIDDRHIASPFRDNPASVPEEMG